MSDPRWIFMCDGSNDAVSGKGVPAGVRKLRISAFREQRCDCACAKVGVVSLQTSEV